MPDIPELDAILQVTGGVRLSAAGVVGLLFRMNSESPAWFSAGDELWKRWWCYVLIVATFSISLIKGIAP